MKKKIFIIFISIIIITIIILELAKRNNENEDSFLWCDAYIAAAEESDLIVSLTYFYISNPVEFSDVSAIELVSVSNISVSSFEYYNLDKSSKYNSIGLDLNLHFGKSSYLECDTIKLVFEDGKSRTYKVGNLKFDIGEKETQNQNLDIWESPVASAYHSEFPYYYIPSEKISNVRIQYGEKQIMDVNITEKSEISGEIELNCEAPLTLIRPRILCETFNGVEIYYGNTCYCGALNIKEEDIEESYTYLSE